MTVPAAQTLFEEAARLVAEGRSRAAIAPLEAALAHGLDTGAAWRLLGDIRLAAGDVAAAQVAYDRMLTAVAPDVRLKPIAADLAAGRLDAAVAVAAEAVRAAPGFPPALHLLGEALARQGRLADAEAVLTECLARAPGLRLARLAHALLLQRLGRHGEALGQLGPLLAADPEHHRARMAQALSLTELGDHAAAVEAMAAVVAAFPDQPRVWLLHGNGLRTTGRFDDAVAAYRRSLELEPCSGEAWWSLANLKTYRFSPSERAAIVRLADAKETPPEQVSYVRFALGKACEDAGRDAEAFAHYAAANAIQRTLRSYDPAETTALARRSIALLTPEFFAARAGWGDPSDAPIFIVGLPRSGSTLVEQILASHPAIEATSELMDVQAMAEWAAQKSSAGYPAALASLSRDEVAALGRDFLAGARPRRRLDRPRFIDKAPWNWTHLGLIRLMLPAARIVDVRRHPLACGFSVFRQHFAAGSDFAYGLADIGRYYADYVALMAHVDAAQPGAVHRVVYERLVEDTEAEVRRLLDFLALPFDPACLRFHATQRAIATPSGEQVRRPIFTEGLDEWRRFETELAPLKAALGPALAAYPDPA
jgi:tetratricopeptide (TPR) repeat protein